jgi:hypothetical protein
MGTGSDYGELAKGPLAEMRYARRKENRESKSAHTSSQHQC